MFWTETVPWVLFTVVVLGILWLAWAQPWLPDYKMPELLGEMTEVKDDIHEPQRFVDWEEKWD